MRYLKLSKDRYTFGDYSITSIRMEDQRLIMQWRNEQLAVLRQGKLLTEADQQRYFEQVVAPTLEEEKPRIMLFSYFLQDRLIGYGGLTNIDWFHGRAEISYLVETERCGEREKAQYAADFGHFLRLMQLIAGRELKLNRLFTETYDIRPFHIHVLELHGFRPEGRLREHVKIDGSYVDSILHGCLLKEQDEDEQ